jgi:hypothetical protein
VEIQLQNRTAIPVLVVASAGTPLAVPLILQEQTEWCWAACAAMVLGYYQASQVTQCQLADWLFGPAACCVAPASAACNKPCQVAHIKQILAHWLIQSTSVQGSVSFATLHNEVAAKRPVEVAFHWGMSGHVALVVEASWISGQPWVRVNDPKFHSGLVSYAELLVAYGFGSWFWSWIGISN